MSFRGGVGGTSSTATGSTATIGTDEGDGGGTLAIGGGDASIEDTAFVDRESTFFDCVSGVADAGGGRLELDKASCDDGSLPSGNAISTGGDEDCMVVLLGGIDEDAIEMTSSPAISLEAVVIESGLLGGKPLGRIGVAAAGRLEDMLGNDSGEAVSLTDVAGAFTYRPDQRHDVDRGGRGAYKCTTPWKRVASLARSGRWLDSGRIQVKEKRLAATEERLLIASLRNE